ncbi:MAG: transketolase C-terminal domain-containing protein [Candidatus Eremiobacteraeota bacterium]|nr:transketolase C-terminal domain-containing protein [Candidatus Eremiobacteraeota bacterium]
MSHLSMRDAFFNKLYDIAKSNRDIFVVSADMGAPSLDRFRSDLGPQFINVGIAEHNMVTVATGLALEGKKCYLYAIMPFVTSRCYEMIKVDMSLMNLPITAVGVGSGFSYDDSGPTHHSTEDVSIMRVLPHMTILNSSDSVMASRFAEMTVTLEGPSYVRLDREAVPPLYPPGETFQEGHFVHHEGRDLLIIATGTIIRRALVVREDLREKGVDAGVIDLYRLKPLNEEALVKLIAAVPAVVTLEEHLLAGGLGSILAELMADSGILKPLVRVGIKDRYYYAYGGRNNIHGICGIDREAVVDKICSSLPAGRH